MSIADSNDVKNQKRSKSKINSYLPSVKKRTSSLHGKTSPASKHYKEAKDNTDGYSLVPTTPNRPVIAAIENGIPRSKIAKSFFQVTIWLYFDNSLSSFVANLLWSPSSSFSYKAIQYQGWSRDTEEERVVGAKLVGSILFLYCAKICRDLNCNETFMSFISGTNGYVKNR